METVGSMETKVLRISVVVVHLLATAFLFSNESANASLEFKTIHFAQSRPGRSESYGEIDQILDEAERKSLDDLLRALKANPVIGAEIVGYADKRECEQSLCHQLSLHRATVVYDWFRSRGVPDLQLRGPIGESIDYPVDGGETSEGRALNRRVQLEPYIVPKTES